MGRDDDEPLPPKRPRPRPAPSSLQEGQETFRPASGSSPAPSTGWKAKKPADRLERSLDDPRREAGGANLIERTLFGSVSSGHLATFCGQFARYQEAGVDLVRSLASLQKQFSRTALGPVIGRIEAAVRSGDSVASAMAREPHAFDKLCLSMMRVAEARGGEPETLKGLAKHYEARQRMIRQARSAMIYPAIVLTIAFAVVMLLTIFVIPKMVEFIADSLRGKNFDLPWPTQALMWISRFMTQVGWWAVPLGTAALVFGSLWWYRTPAGRAMFDSLSLYVPVLGSIRKKIETTRFARTLAALINAGVDVGQSLELTSDVLTLAPYRRAIRGVKAEVMDGSEMSVALAETGRFPHDVIARVEAGEETGKLPETLDKVADDYEEQVEMMIKNLGQLVQPVLMIVLGGVVLFVALGIILAYLKMLTSAAG